MGSGSDPYGTRILETRQMWVNGAKAQRAAQFPDGVMERMIDFNPEEETITIPTPQTAGLNTASQVEMIVHQRWAIAILRVKEMITEGAKTVVRFHDPESRLEFAHPWPQPVIDGEKGNSSFVWSTLWSYWTSPENGIRIILPDASIITRVLTKT